MKSSKIVTLFVVMALMLGIGVPVAGLEGVERGLTQGQGPDLPPTAKAPAPASTGRVPAGTVPRGGTSGPSAFPQAGPPAYALDLYPGASLVYIPDLAFPGTWNIVGSVPEFFSAGDFLGSDYSKIYALNHDTDEFVTINTTTAARTVLGVSSQPEYWTGMTGTLGGTLYASASTCGTSSTLYRVNPSNGALTWVGDITNGTCIIDIAINTAGQMYGVDLIDNVLVRIDPATAAGTVVGPLGFDANYAQGMDFDDATGVLYLAAFNGDTTQGELRIANTTTGNTTLVGVFPNGAEVDLLSIKAGTAPPAAPTLYNIGNTDGDGTYLVDWSSPSGATNYGLQEDDNPSFSSPTTRYSGPNSQFQVTGQPGGTWYYRVQASNAAGYSPWSNTRSVQVTTQSNPSQVYLPLVLRNWSTSTDPYEPNDTFETAWGPLVSGATYYGFFPTTADNNDFYYIDLPAAHSIEVWLTGLPAGNDYDLYLYDAAHVYIQHSGNVGTVDEHILVSNKPAGRYYIRVTREAGTSATQPYALRAVYQ
jgi:hypothetical protein